MTKQRWTRQRAGHGPADTLDDRYEVRKFGNQWVVWDRVRKTNLTLNQRTMRDARQAAEGFAMREAWHIANEIDRLERTR